MKFYQYFFLFNIFCWFNVSFAESSTSKQHMVTYWCGPTYGCGGASSDFSDIPDKTTDVLIAFALVDANGTVSFSYYDSLEHDITNLQEKGIKVSLSIGGAAQDPTPILENPDTFAQSAATIMNDYKFDGINMDVEHLETSEQITQYISVLEKLRAEIGQEKLLSDAPQCPYIYSGVSGISGYYNLYIPLINKDKTYTDAGKPLIDYYFVQSYNNWCNEYPSGSLDSLKQIASDWIAPYPQNGYNGMSPEKLVMGVPSSPDTRDAIYGYVEPVVLEEFLGYANATYHNKMGAGYWDAYYDSLNHFLISEQMTESLGFNDISLMSMSTASIKGNFVNFDDDQTGVYTSDDFQKDWNMKPTSSSGQKDGRLHIVYDEDSTTDKVLEVTYLEDEYGGNSAMVFTPYLNGKYTHLFFQYDVKFASDFTWVKGGKLPGLTSSPDSPTGCIDNGTFDGFSARLMWREMGEAYSYLYTPYKEEKCGDYYEYNSPAVYFIPGVWYTLTQEIRLNDPGLENGYLKQWIDGVLVLDLQNIILRKSGDIYIDQIKMDTFFGGPDSSWAPDEDQHSFFNNFTVSETKPDM